MIYVLFYFKRLDFENYMLRGSNILFIRINQLPKEQYNAPNHISYESNKKKPTENNISFLSYLFSSLPVGTNPPPPQEFPLPPSTLFGDKVSNYNIFNYPYHCPYCILYFPKQS